MPDKPIASVAGPNFPAVNWFSEDSPLPELVLLIDALLPEHRVPILQAALDFSPSGDFATSYVVGIYRSKLFHCLAQRLPSAAPPRMIRRIDPGKIEPWLRPLSLARDEIQVTLALCDLMGVLVKAIIAETKGCRTETLHAGGS